MPCTVLRTTLDFLLCLEESKSAIVGRGGLAMISIPMCIEAVYFPPPGSPVNALCMARVDAACCWV